MFEFYRKDFDDDILVMGIDEKGDYAIASRNDHEPDTFIHYPDHDLRGWKRITAVEAAKILGYDPAE